MCGVILQVLQATMTGALARVVGTTLALWLPLVPLYLFVRHAISSRSPSRSTHPRPPFSSLQQSATPMRHCSP